MLQIGDFTLREEEVERVAWRNGSLTLRFKWRFEELPVLLDLPAEDDPEAGVPLRLRCLAVRGPLGSARALLLSDATRAAPVEPPLG